MQISPDVSAVGDRCTHGRHFLANHYAPSQLPEGDGPCCIADEQEVCGRGGVGEGGGPVHASLNGQLMLAGVQLAYEGGVLLGLQGLHLAHTPLVMLCITNNDNTDMILTIILEWMLSIRFLFLLVFITMTMINLLFTVSAHDELGMYGQVLSLHNRYIKA